jgi:16S rRNA (cytosine967-C5)-methyltransferase
VPVSKARAAAFDILLQVEKQQAYGSELLHSSQYQQLSFPDHGLATELVMGVLRWRSLLDRQVAKASTLALNKLDVEVLTALRLAAYQLMFLDRVPASAAVNESVDLVKRARKRSAMPFANAVLRKLSTELPKSKSGLLSSPGGNVHELADASAHPLWIVDRWTNEYGLRVAKQICEYNQRIPETSIRLKNFPVENELREQGIELAPGALLTSSRRIKSGDLGKAAAFRAGLVSIQDEASQLVALLIGKGSAIMDCCAAPGGKTRIMSERNPEAEIFAMDLHPHRARLLRKLVPAGNVKVVGADVLNIPTASKFDRVLVDVPCSGTGTLARNPEIKWRLTMDDISDLKARQFAILQSAMKSVSKNGRLVYSTCSMEREENSAVVEKALSENSSFHIVDCREILNQLESERELASGVGIDSLVSGQYLRTLPGIHPTDGFFAAILERE